LCELGKVEEETVFKYPIGKIFRILEFEKDRAEVMKAMIKNQIKK